MYQQLWGYKVEDKLYLGVREQKRLNTTELDNKKEQMCRLVRENLRTTGVDTYVYTYIRARYEPNNCIYFKGKASLWHDFLVFILDCTLLITLKHLVGLMEVCSVHWHTVALKMTPTFFFFVFLVSVLTWLPCEPVCD
jgi:hypothetical protein